ncbi:MAG TPA: outer membrane beta-barrel protein [Saprospiraceae bacterium]|nr:outer membrane beta-barrel protein [Saprospiraceae bacterium]
MKQIIITFLFISLSFSSTQAQHGVQIGVGLGTMMMAYNDDRPQSVSPLSQELKFATITGHNAYYFDLKLDYAFSPKWQLRSGLQYRFRTISFLDNNSLNRRTDMISIPFMLRYSESISAKHGLSLGLSAGLTLDRYFENEYLIQYTGTKDDIVESSRIFDDFSNGGILSLNGSWRFGIDIEKDLGDKGRIGLQFMYSYTHLGNVVDSYSEAKQKVYDPLDNNVLLSEKTETILYDGRQSGYQIGVNYYFGALNWNKK